MDLQVVAPPAPSGTTRSRQPSAALRAARQFAEWLGFPLLLVDSQTGEILTSTGGEHLPIFPDSVKDLLHEPAGSVRESPSGLAVFTLPVPSHLGVAATALGYALTRPDSRPADLVLAAARAGWSAAQFDGWLARLPYCRPSMLRRQVNLVLQQIRAEAVGKEQFDAVMAQLEYSYEEICLLHFLTQNMQLSRSPRELSELSLERLSGVIQAEAHVLILGEPQSPQAVLELGQSPLGENGLCRLVMALEHDDWSRPLVKNSVGETLLGAEFPGLRNFVLSPIAERQHRFGWLCSCNLVGGDFGTVQASLLSSVASILGTHGRNSQLYREHEELLLSFVRSLVSSLDAKDAYTRGHSERVALIARRIGEQLRLPEDDLNDIYLSGLLHDIGKIGVDDSVLRKPGALTPDEFDQIKKHPVIGYNILCGLKNLRAILPGVRHHHEAWNGKGYPDGLAGEDIPLMARILAVADSYDAMGSDRPYRKGMPLPKLDGILREGAGGQWDPRVVEAYTHCREDIDRICKTYTPTPVLQFGEQVPECDTPQDVRAALSLVAGA